MLLRFIMPCFSILSKTDIEKILGKNRNGFRRNRSTTSQTLTISKLFKEICTNVDFSKPFHSIRRERMEQIIQAYGLPIFVKTIMILYKNSKAMVCSPDGTRTSSALQQEFFHRVLHQLKIYLSSAPTTYFVRQQI